MEVGGGCRLTINAATDRNKKSLQSEQSFDALHFVIFKYYSIGEVPIALLLDTHQHVQPTRFKSLLWVCYETDHRLCKGMKWLIIANFSFVSWIFFVNFIDSLNRWSEMLSKGERASKQKQETGTLSHSMTEKLRRSWLPVWAKNSLPTSEFLYNYCELSIYFTWRCNFSSHDIWLMMTTSCINLIHNVRNFS